jgi:hypothetical protein
MNVPDNDPAVGSERQGASLRRLALREAQGFFIGSGAMESAGNPITAARIKGPGMRWKVTDLNTLLAFLCPIHSLSAKT